MAASNNRQRGYLLLIPSAALAVVVVFLLLFLMQALINVDPEAPDQEDRVNIGNIWQEQEEIEERTKEREPEELEEPEMQPDTPEQDMNVDSEFESVNLDTSFGAGDMDISAGSSVSDGDIIPLVAIQPNYPRRAAERGLEGYCVVSFDITTSGTTKNVEEEECTSSLFVRSSIQAAEKLKYKPRVVDGKPIEVEDHYYKFTYELSD